MSNSTDLGGIRGVETIIRIYSVKNICFQFKIFNNKLKSKKNQLLTVEIFKHAYKVARQSSMSVQACFS